MTKTRGHGGKWIPGISGNPNGRPKVIAAIRDAARGHTAAALKRLVHLMDSGDEKIALAAVQEMLSRGWGRPEVAMAVTTNTQAPPGATIENRVKPGMSPQEAAEAYMQMLKITDPPDLYGRH